MHYRLGAFFPVSWKIWILKLKTKLLPNLLFYILCILKAGIWLPSKWHYFHSSLTSNVCYWIDNFSFSILNGFLINFCINYSLKLVFVWLNISCILRTRLLYSLVDVVKNTLGSISFLLPYHFLLGAFVFLCILNSYLIK